MLFIIDENRMTPMVHECDGSEMHSKVKLRIVVVAAAAVVVAANRAVSRSCWAPR